MSTVVIDLAFGKIHLRGESLHLVGIPWEQNHESEPDAGTAEEISRIIPLSQVEHLVISPQITMSGAMMQALLSRGV